MITRLNPKIPAPSPLAAALVCVILTWNDVVAQCCGGAPAVGGGTSNGLEATLPQDPQSTCDCDGETTGINAIGTKEYKERSTCTMSANATFDGYALSMEAITRFPRLTFHSLHELVLEGQQDCHGVSLTADLTPICPAKMLVKDVSNSSGPDGATFLVNGLERTLVFDAFEDSEQRVARSHSLSESHTSTNCTIKLAYPHDKTKPAGELIDGPTFMAQGGLRMLFSAGPGSGYVAVMPGNLENGAALGSMFTGLYGSGGTAREYYSQDGGGARQLAFVQTPAGLIQVGSVSNNQWNLEFYVGTTFSGNSVTIPAEPTVRWNFRFDAAISKLIMRKWAGNEMLVQYEAGQELQTDSGLRKEVLNLDGSLDAHIEYPENEDQQIVHVRIKENPDGSILEKTEDVYGTMLDANTNQVSFLISRRRHQGPGLPILTETFEYVDNPTNNFGRLSRHTAPDGTYRDYVYTTKGLLEKEIQISPDDETPGMMETVYSYMPDLRMNSNVPPESSVRGGAIKTQVKSVVSKLTANNRVIRSTGVSFGTNQNFVTSNYSGTNIITNRYNFVIPVTNYFHWVEGNPNASEYEVNYVLSRGNLPDWQKGRTLLHVSREGIETYYSYESGSLSSADPLNFVANATGQFIRTTARIGKVGDPGYLTKGSTTQSIVDKNGRERLRLRRVHDPDSGFDVAIEQTLNRYDTMGNLTNTTVNGEIQYEALQIVDGRVLSERDAEGRTTLYAYDALGRVATQRVLAVTAPGFQPVPEQVQTFVYDGLGRVRTNRLTVGNLTTVRTTEYDWLGNVMREVGPDGLETRYVHDEVNRIDTTYLPGHSESRPRTRISTRRPNGNPLSETGTTQAPKYFRSTYPLDFVNVSETWNNSTSNGLAHVRTAKATHGRVLSRSQPNPSTPGQPSYASTLYEYNAKGQLSVENRTSMGDATNRYANTYHGYDDFDGSQVVQSQYDGLAAVGELGDPADPQQRVQKTETRFRKHDGYWWRETTQLIFPDSNGGRAVTSSIHRVALTAVGALTNPRLSESVDRFGNVTRQSTTVDRETGLTVATQASPVYGTNISYSVLGRLMKSINPYGGVFSNLYDGLGRVTDSWNPSTGHTHYTYTPQGWLDVTTTESGSVTDLDYYTDTGWVKSVTRNGVSTYYDYDAIGRKIREWGPGVYPVAYGYDDQGRMTTLTTYRTTPGIDWDTPQWPTNAPPGQTTTWVYDPFTGVLTEKLYPPAQENEPSLGPKYEYYANGSLKKRLWARGPDGSPSPDDQNRVSTTYSYNPFGQMTLIDYSDNTPDVTFQYSRIGLLTNVEDAVGTWSNRYDQSTLQLEAEVLSGQNYPTQHLEYQPDALGRPGGYTLHGSNGFSIGYGYDAQGRFNRLTTSRGQRADYTFRPGTDQNTGYTLLDQELERFALSRTFDNAGRLLSITNQTLSATNATPHVLGVRYELDVHGRRTAALWDDRWVTPTLPLTRWDYAYDTRSQLTNAVQRVGLEANDPAIPGRSNGYQYDHIGNRLSATGDAGTSIYQSNALNQYESRTVPTNVHAAAMAKFGETADTAVRFNHTAATKVGDYHHALLAVTNLTNAVALAVQSVVSNTVLHVSTNAEPFTLFAPETPEVFRYDADGNLVEDGRWTYTWNAENRLVGMVTRSNLVAQVPRQRLTFAYDYAGRRRVKQVETSPDLGATWSIDNRHTFAYEGWNMIQQRSQTFTPGTGIAVVHHAFVWGRDLSDTVQGAGGVGGLLMQWHPDDQGSNQTYFVAYDGNGNVVGRSAGPSLTNNIKYEYGSFGTHFRHRGDDSSPNEFPFRFATKFLDSNSEQYYFGFRYYSITTISWLNRDPADEYGGLNQYAYCENRPGDYFDFLGLVKDDGGDECPEECLGTATINVSKPRKSYGDQFMEPKLTALVKKVWSGLEVTIGDLNRAGFDSGHAYLALHAPKIKYSNGKLKQELNSFYGFYPSAKGIGHPGIIKDDNGEPATNKKTYKICCDKVHTLNSSLITEKVDGPRPIYNVFGGTHCGSWVISKISQLGISVEIQDQSPWGLAEKFKP